jgi:ATP-binding cassette, subfamily B, bacterial MsbA
MTHVTSVLRFAWTYLQRYRGRLVFGILFGVFFGVANASFVWATRTITDRLGPAPRVNAVADASVPVPDAVAQPQPRKSFSASLSQRVKRVETRIATAVDPWLPRRGAPLDWRKIVGGILFLPLLVTIRSGSGYLSSYCMGWVSERVINDIRYDVLAKLSTLSLEFFDRSRTGDLLARINTDTANLQRTLRSGFGDAVKETITVASIFVMLCVIDLKLTLFSMVVLPICLAPVFVLGRKARRASRATVAASVSQFSQLVELFAGIRIIKAFGLETAQLDRFRRLSRELVRQGMKGIKAKEMVNPVIEILSTAAIGVLIVYLFYAQHTIQDLVAFLTGLLLFYTPVKKLAGLHVMMEQTSVGVFRLMEVLAEHPSVREPVTPRPITAFRSDIVFDSVGFDYGQKPVLHDLTLRIPRGMRLGVAGPSGSGKSTLVNLLFRFYDPTKGLIRLDGVDVREFSTRDLRQLMALVSQEIVLFDQSVADNIACGRPGATRDEIVSAARAAFADEFISQLPEGYDTVIGERGVTLSGGQRQRLAIARAFVRDAPILVLDEATAALDAQAEGVVQAAIDHLSEHRTVVAVAHRLATLAAMDQIAFLVDGRIVEFGSFDQLLKRGGRFAEMANRQGIHSVPVAQKGQSSFALGT